MVACLGTMYSVFLSQHLMYSLRVSNMPRACSLITFTKWPHCNQTFVTFRHPFNCASFIYTWHCYPNNLSDFGFIKPFLPQVLSYIGRCYHSNLVLQTYDFICFLLSQQLASYHTYGCFHSNCKSI